MQLIFLITTLLYAVASLAFALNVLRPAPSLSAVSRAESGMPAAKSSRLGPALLTIALFGHLLYVGLLHANRDSGGLGAAAHLSIPTVLSAASFGLAATFLLFWLKQSAGLGAFVTSLSMLWFAVAAFDWWPARELNAATLPSWVPGWVLVTHILGNTFGVATLTLAALASGVYLVQESNLRKKRVGAAFARMPALGALDRLTHKALILGVPCLTVGVVTGIAWSLARHGAMHLSPSQIFAALAWLILALLVVGRVVIGFRGRRSAWVTVIGGAMLMVTLLAYAVRGAA